MPTAKISNTTPYTTYNMRVQARNSIGTGPISGTVSAQFNGCANAVFNENFSSGVTFSTLENPDGDDKNYRLAEINAPNGTLAIDTPGLATALIVAGGGGGHRGGGNGSSGGGAGGAIELLLGLDAIAYTANVGAGGAGQFTAATGNETTFAGYIIRPGRGGSQNSGASGGNGHSGNGYWSSGGGGGSAGNGGVGFGGGCCCPGGAGLVSSITGDPVEYAQGGVGNAKSGSPGTPGSGGAGGYDSWGDSPGGPGKDGVVYVRVEI